MPKVPLWNKVATLALAAVYGAFVLASVWVRLAANDYCNVVYANEYGPLMGRWLYDRWTNALATTTLFGTLAQHQSGPTGLFTVLALALGLFIIWAVIRRFSVMRGQSLLVALLIALAVFNLAPALGEDFYWETALFEYGVTLILFAGVVWWIARPLPSPPRDLITLWGGGIMAFFAATGATLGAVLFPALLAGLLIGAPLLGLNRKQIGAATLGAVLGAAITLTAPGNAIRAASYPPRNLAAAIVTAFTHVWQPLLDAITHSPAALITLITLPVLAGALFGGDTVQHVKGKPILFLLVLAIGVCILSEFVFAFATGATDYRDFGRAELFPTAIVAVLLALLPVISGTPLWLRSRVIVGGAFMIFAGASLVNAVILNDTLLNYARLWDERDTAVHLGVLTVTPLHVFGLSDLETGWVLDCTRQYYGLPIQAINTQ